MLIIVNIVFAGQMPQSDSQSQISKQNNIQAWWTNGAGGLIGGIAGSVIGIMGATVGTLAGFGVARKLCLLFPRDRGLAGRHQL